MATYYRKKDGSRDELSGPQSSAELRRVRGGNYDDDDLRKRAQDIDGDPTDKQEGT